MNSSETKECRDCGVIQPLDAFPPAAGRSDGRASYCRPCASQRTQASYARRQAELGKTVKKREQFPPGKKRCPDCGRIKSLDDFPKNRGARDGRGGYCKPCHNHRSNETRDRLYGSSRSYHLKARYGITAADYDAMLEAQGGLCAVCRERPAQHVDHDHVFGNVRGLLCSCCNQGLGNFRDDLAHVQAAVDYLERTTWRRHQLSTGVYQLTSPRPAAAASPSSSRPPLLISSLRG